MRGVLSFHAVDLELFDSLIAPLAAGERVNPEKFLDDALRLLAAEWQSLRYRRSLETLLRSLEPPPAPDDGGLWHRVRARLERLDHKPDPTAQRIAGKIEGDLHLHGRPFLITEGSAERVSVLVDEYRAAADDAAVADLLREQLVRLDARLAAEIEPAELAEPPPPASYRAELLRELKAIYDLAGAAREGRSWRAADGRSEPAVETLAGELAWRALQLHGRARPFWIARDVDGLELICRAADVEVPSFLIPAHRLFLRAAHRLPEPGPRLSTALGAAQDVGAFVPVDQLPELLIFLNTEGARIIRAASRHGEGATCAAVLRKIRECATHAERNGLAYVEACGIVRAAEDHGVEPLSPAGEPF